MLRESWLPERELGLLPTQVRQVGESGPPLAAPDDTLADAGVDLLFEEVALLGGQDASQTILHRFDLSLDREVERPSAESLSLVRVKHRAGRPSTAPDSVTTVEARCVPSLDPNGSTASSPAERAQNAGSAPAGDLDRRLFERHELVAEPDGSARKDVGTQSGAMHERPEETWT